MRAWVLWFTHGAVTGVLDCVPDERLSAALAEAGTTLRTLHHVEGTFTRVASPEPYYRDDERVYRCSSLTLIARPFTLEVPE